MGCFVLQQTFLQFFEGKVADVSYEFATEHTIQTVQNQVSYFIIDLDSEESGKEKPINPLQKEQKGRNIIAGILYDYQKDVAEKAKNFILHSVKNNIYVQQKQYKEAFPNIILSLQDFIHSSESSKQFTGTEAHFGNLLVNYFVNNLIMITDGTILLSKPLLKEQRFENTYTVKCQGDKEYREINPKSDLIDKDKYYYQLKGDLTNKISEILLSSSQCTLYSITQDVRKAYPSMSENDIDGHMYFLKIKF